jgi:hypothetical protein
MGLVHCPIAALFAKEKDMLLRHRRLQEATEKANEPHFLEERKGKPSYRKMTPE